jgi:hypothetical protein
MIPDDLSASIKTMSREEARAVVNTATQRLIDLWLEEQKAEEGERPTRK